MVKPAQVRRRKTRSLEELVTILCRLHRRMQAREFKAIDLRNRKRLQDTVHRLAARIDGEYSELWWMLEDREANGPRVRAALKALEIMIREGVGLLKHQRTYLLSALSRSSEAKSLDHAFGVISGKRGKPAVPPARQIDIASRTLRLVLNDEKLESAALQVGKQLDIGATQVRRYYAKNQMAAVYALRSERPFRKDEAKRLKQLLGKSTRAMDKILKQEQSDPAAAFYAGISQGINRRR